MGGELITLLGAITADVKKKAGVDPNSLIPNNNIVIPHAILGKSDSELTTMLITLWIRVKAMWVSSTTAVTDKLPLVESMEAQMFADPNTRKPIPGVTFSGRKLQGTCDPNTKHVCDFGLYISLSESYGDNPLVRATDVSQLMNIQRAEMDQRVAAIVANIPTLEKTIVALMVLINILTRIKAAFAFQAKMPVDLLLALYRTEANLAVPLAADLYLAKYPSAYGYGGAQRMYGFDLADDYNHLGVYLCRKDVVDDAAATPATRQAKIKQMFRVSWLRVFGLDVLSTVDDQAAKLSSILMTNGMDATAANSEASRIIAALGDGRIFKNSGVSISDTDVFLDMAADTEGYPYYSVAPTDPVLFLQELFNVLKIVFSTYRNNVCPQKLPFDAKEVAGRVVIVNNGDGIHDYDFLSNTPSHLNQELTPGASYLNFHATGHMSAIIADVILHAKTSTSARFSALRQSIATSPQLSALTALDNIKRLRDYYNDGPFGGAINNPDLLFINSLKRPEDMDSLNVRIRSSYESLLASYPLSDRERVLTFIKKYLVTIKWTKVGYLMIMEIKSNLWTNILAWVNSDAANITRLCDFIENCDHDQWPWYNLHRANMSKFMLLQDFYRRLFVS